MIKQIEHQNRLNSEVDRYIQKMEEERKSVDFIQLDFLVDMRVANNRYREEYKKDVGGIRTNLISFDQWLECKKFEASKFYMKHSDYYLGF